MLSFVNRIAKSLQIERHDMFYNEIREMNQEEAFLFKTYDRILNTRSVL